jgi:hypothetical protein
MCAKPLDSPVQAAGKLAPAAFRLQKHSPTSATQLTQKQPSRLKNQAATAV